MEFHIYSTLILKIKMNIFIKKFFKIGLKFILFFTLLIATYLILSLILSKISVNNISQNDEIELYVMSNGVHTDIVMPVKNEIIDWSQKFEFKNTLSKDSNFKYLAVGWGDRGFYLETPEWKDLKFSTAFKAAFGLGKTALHCTYYKTISINKNCKKLTLNKQNYQKLVNYILNTAQSEKDVVKQIKTNAVYSQSDSFYEAKGSYSMFKTCNTWTNQALKECGTKCSLWTPFDFGVMNHY